MISLSFQVNVRIRPPSKDEEEEESVVQKLSGNSVSISDHTFTFDSVANTGCSQVTSIIFELLYKEAFISPSSFFLLI
jgi:DNA replication protein DnaD